MDGIVGYAVVGTDLHYHKIPRLRHGVLTQKVRQASLWEIVKIPVEADEQGIVGGTHVEMNHFPALLKVSFQGLERSW